MGLGEKMTIRTETLDLSIGRRVAAARTASGCAVTEAAARLNIAEQRYFACELGDHRFRSRDLAILARLFNVDVRRFFEDETPTLGSAALAHGFVLADWIEASRHREGLSALLLSDRDILSDPPNAEAA